MGTGVIPACAGNRGRYVASTYARPGHPCVCGEQVAAPRGALWDVGLSLRVRGTDSVSWCAIEFSCQIQTL